MRPQFLIAGLFLNILGVAVAIHLGAHFDLAKVFVFQIVVASLQMAGAAANEYADVETDRINANRTWFSGGSGVIASGALGRDVAMMFTFVWGIVALLAGMILSVALGVTYVLPAMTILGLALALSYSLWPLKLSYIGLGELTMGVMVSIMVPIAAFLVLHEKYDGLILTASLPVFFQLLALMMVVQYPDYEADMRTGKRNLVVRLGKQTSWRIGVILLLIAAASSFYGALFGIPAVVGVSAGMFLLMEALFFFIAESHLRSRTIMFWSTAISSGFYILVVALLAVGFVVLH